MLSLSVQSLPAPWLPVVHIPADMLSLTVPVLGPVLLPLKWLYVSALLLALWMGAGVIARHFGSFLYIVFALSIIVPGFELLRDVYVKYA